MHDKKRHCILIASHVPIQTTITACGSVILVLVFYFSCSFSYFASMKLAFVIPHTCTRGKVIGCACLLSLLPVCQAILLVLNTLKSCFLSWHPWACLSTTPIYLATCWMGDDSFTRVHYTACICVTTVCFYPHGSTCSARGMCSTEL